MVASKVVNVTRPFLLTRMVMLILVGLLFWAVGLR
jgi:hypothetical protein